MGYLDRLQGCIAIGRGILHDDLREEAPRGGHRPILASVFTRVVGVAAIADVYNMAATGGGRGAGYGMIAGRSARFHGRSVFGSVQWLEEFGAAGLAWRDAATFRCATDESECEYDAAWDDGKEGVFGGATC